jgi:hypothetical protein
MISMRRISSVHRNHLQDVTAGRAEAMGRSKPNRLASLPEHHWRDQQTVDNSNTKAKILAAVRLDIKASAHLRDVMLGELNDIGSEDEATKWAHRRLPEKNKLNAADAKHVEEAFRTKLLSFAIHQAGGRPESTKETQNSGSSAGDNRKAKCATLSRSVEKSVLLHPEPRRILTARRCPRGHHR